MDIQRYLEQFPRTSNDNTLEAMKWVMEKFDNPHMKCKIVHIAGTNGKASVLEMLNSVLQKQGYKVGKYISPHLIKFNERICLNDLPILDEEIEEIIKEMEPFVQEYNQTHDIPVKHFEVITSIAFIYFARKKCDIVLLETGLGGTWDSTNIVFPLFSIITSIGFDHMKTLGNTLTEIAQNKAGIIKKNTDVIFLELDNNIENNEVLKVITDKCKKEKSKLYIIKKNQITNYSYDEENKYFNYEKYKNIIINLKGKVQIYNAAICIKALELLREKGYIISEENIRKGLNTIRNLARFEVIYKNPTIIYDGAHNLPAIENFIKNMKKYYQNKEKVYIISVLKKKDYNMMIKCLSQDKNAILFLTDGNNKTLYASKEELYKTAISYMNKEKVYKMDLKTAIQIAIDKYPNRVIGIIGSFYIYGDSIEAVKQKKM